MAELSRFDSLGLGSGHGVCRGPTLSPLPRNHSMVSSGVLPWPPSSLARPLGSGRNGKGLVSQVATFRPPGAAQLWNRPRQSRTCGIAWWLLGPTNTLQMTALGTGCTGPLCSRPHPPLPEVPAGLLSALPISALRCAPLCSPGWKKIQEIISLLLLFMSLGLLEKEHFFICVEN